MSREVNGVQTIIKSSRLICRMVTRFGTAALLDWTTPELVAAVEALQVACLAFEALDDYPGKVDRTSGGFRDGVPVG
jgi:hypothetical protein